MALYLRIFDPKGFQNPYKGSNWREVSRERVEPVEAVRPHKIVNELDMISTEGRKGKTRSRVPPIDEDDSQDKKSSSEEGQDDPIDPQQSSIKSAEKEEIVEQIVSREREFYGPADIQAIAGDLIEESFNTLAIKEDVEKAANLLKKVQAHYLPVVNQQEKICGLISQNQIFRHLVEKKSAKRNLKDFSLEEFMISPVLCCLEETPILVIIETMLKEQVGVLPVVDSNDHLKGIITKEGVLQFIIKSPHFFPSKKNQE